MKTVFSIRRWQLTFIGLMMAAFCSAQDQTRILFVLDASLSMGNEWRGGTKWGAAVSALTEKADGFSQIPKVEMGLLVFGHLFPLPDKNCHDSRLEVPIGPNTAARILKRLESIRPQ